MDCGRISNMKKIIAIGDIHGRTSWSKIIEENPDADRIIFIGDYFDAPPSKRHLGMYGVHELENFKNILAYKRSNPEKTVLLLGNHDYHYLSGVNAHYSGFQMDMYTAFSQELEQAILDRLLKWTHLEDGYLFSHAGVSKTWFKNTGVSHIHEINDLSRGWFGFIPGAYHDSYGDEVCQSPTWIRPNSLLNDPIDGYKQVVGHTRKPFGVEIIENVYFIDCLESNYYLSIMDGKAEPVKYVTN
jgi:hypothetical protein